MYLHALGIIAMVARWALDACVYVCLTGQDRKATFEVRHLQPHNLP